MLLIDVIGSNVFGTRVRLKQELVTEIAAVLAFSAIQNNDKVGVIFFSNRIEKFIPPKKGTSHILRIIRELIDFQPENKETSVSGCLKFFTNVIKKRCTAFLISDFLDKGFDDALKISNRKHDLIAVHILDQRELDLPSAGIIRIKHAETGKSFFIDSTDQKTRTLFRNHASGHQQFLKDLFVRSGVDVVRIFTDQDYVRPLIGLFKMRESRR